MTESKWSIPITIVLFMMGLFLSFQYQAQHKIANNLSLERTENLIVMVRNLSEKRQKLALEIYDLNNKLDTLIENSSDQRKLIADINEQAEKYAVLTGSIPLQGNGLTVTFDRYMPILYIDIINVINELWAAGAEAIAVNDQRINVNSSIFYVEDENNMYITANNYKMDFPLIITALGNSNNLEKGLTLPGGIVDNLALFNAFPRLEKSDELTVPQTALTPRYIFLREYQPSEAIPQPSPAIPAQP